MKVLITGADGFIGKNLCLRLSEFKDIEIIYFTRRNAATDLPVLLQGVDFVFHLAGVNRPQDPEEFITGNTELTSLLCTEIASVAANTGKKIPVLMTSSIHAITDSPYGKSKLSAEKNACDILANAAMTPLICRLPGVFGKWAKPNYNSVVATFCYNVSHDIDLSINNSSQLLSLVYIDDVLSLFVKLLNQNASHSQNSIFVEVTPVHSITLGELANVITNFKVTRDSLVIDHVGKGLIRALYSTYVSYLSPESFIYDIPEYKDPRGSFVEVIKTHDSGQVSFFTAYPGVTRGGHYHHTKTEKFLVIKGEARFRFRHMITNEICEIYSGESKSQIIETIPGWAHDVTNVGSDELIAIVWANEIFDKAQPDTIASTL